MSDDEALAGELEAEARTYLQRAVDVGNALVDLDPSNADGYYFLAQAQSLLGDAMAADENLNTYNELMGIE
jgi:predicted Zn-dependent protease